MKQRTLLIKQVVMAVCAAVMMPLVTSCSSTAAGGSAGEFVDDAVITARVKAALARDDRLNGSAVDVVTHEGVVQLSGLVDSEAGKRRAAQSVSGVSGVTGVVNNIGIRNPGTQAPSE